jgi:hypothetical protein
VKIIVQVTARILHDRTSARLIDAASSETICSGSNQLWIMCRAAMWR